MRPFQLDSSMTTLRGTFYPTGWTVLMFPGRQQARDAADLLSRDGVGQDAMMYLSPEDIRRSIGGAIGDNAIMPSAGSEGDTARKIVDLAAKGGHGLMVHTPDQADADRVMALLKGVPIAYGQRYRKLVIEDLVT